jgi:hypothetical protein
MPKWLEERIIERKRRAIIDLARLGGDVLHELYETDQYEQGLDKYV